jgi:hypothetical protein
MNGRTGFPIPHHGGFALIGDADGGNVRRSPGSRGRFLRHLNLR